MANAAFQDKAFMLYYTARLVELEDEFDYRKNHNGACDAALHLDAALSNESWIASMGLIESARREVLGNV